MFNNALLHFAHHCVFSAVIANNLSLKVQGNASKVIVEWDSITNATGYTVYWCQTANGKPLDCQVCCTNSSVQYMH